MSKDTNLSVTTGSSPPHPQELTLNIVFAFSRKKLVSWKNHMFIANIYVFHACPEDKYSKIHLFFVQYLPVPNNRTALMPSPVPELNHIC